MPRIDKKPAFVAKDASSQEGTWALSSEALYVIAGEVAARLSTNDFTHLLFSIQDTASGVRLYSVCRKPVFEALRRVEAQGGDGSRHSLFFIAEAAGDDFQIYSVVVPQALLTKTLIFRGIDAAGKQTRVWTAGRKLRLPEGWRFTKNHLSLKYDISEIAEDETVSDWRVFIRNWSIDGRNVRIGLNIIGRPEANECTVQVFKFRNESIRFSQTISMQPAIRTFRLPSRLHRHYTRRSAYHADFASPVDDIFSGAGLYSIMVRVGDDKPRGIYPYNRHYDKKAKLLSTLDGGRYHMLHQFADRASRNLRLEYMVVDESDAAEATKLIDPTSTDYSERDVWLVGEYPSTARDNGWHLFNYVKRSHPEIPVRYVIDLDNHDGIIPDGKSVVAYGSIEHMRACRLAAACLFTHHSPYIRPNLFREAVDRGDSRPIDFFLQHGVLAIKPVLEDYRRSRQRLDLFNVSSEREKHLVMRECGYRDREVVIAGLPRWDALYLGTQASTERRRTVSPPPRVLVFPTWRKGLDKLSLEEFRESQFFTSWTEAVARLRMTAELFGGTVEFCMHSIFERFAREFIMDGVKVVSIVDVTAELNQYDVLITDYSSLCFDFLYINRPSVFFMFDQESYFAAGTSYVQTEELPGPIVETPSELCQAIFSSKGLRSITLQRRVKTVRTNYIAFEDEQNCERVVEATKKRLAQASREPRLATL